MKTIRQVRFEIIEANLLNEQKALFKSIQGLNTRISWAAAARDKARIKELRQEGEVLALWCNALLKAFKKLYYSDDGKKYLLDGAAVIDNLAGVYGSLINVVYF